MRLGLLNCAYNTIDSSIRAHNITLKIVNLLVLSNSYKMLDTKAVQYFSVISFPQMGCSHLRSMVLSGDENSNHRAKTLNK